MAGGGIRWRRCCAFICCRTGLTSAIAGAADVPQVEHLLHGKVKSVHGDAGYVGAEKRVVSKKIQWHIAERRGKVNTQRLLAPIGYVPPAEAQANCCRQLASPAVSVAA